MKRSLPNIKDFFTKKQLHSHLEMVLLLAKIKKKNSMKPTFSCTCKLPKNTSECTILNVSEKNTPPPFLSCSRFKFQFNLIEYPVSVDVWLRFS
jgi:hypothetical protein